VNRRWNSRLFRIPGNSAAQNVQLGWPSRLEIEEETRLRSRRQSVDCAGDLRRFVVGERDAAGARDVDRFLHRTLQQSAAERSLAQGSKRSTGESASSSDCGKEDELLPEIDVDPV
jgi:hypothetical protein